MIDMSRIFGYVRVSTKEQHPERQIDELKKYVSEDNIFVDKASGKDFNRPKYQAIRQLLTKGDTLYVKSLDRLGRNKDGIKEELKYFKDKGVQVKILNIPTTTQDLSQYDDSMQASIFEMVNNILIEVLGTIADQERKTIKERQKEGIASAKARGKHLGRPSATYPDNWKDVYKQWQDSKITAKTAMELTGLKRTTFYHLAKEYKAKAK